MLEKTHVSDLKIASHMIEISPETIAQLLYLVHDDPEELEQALASFPPKRQRK